MKQLFIIFVLLIISFSTKSYASVQCAIYDAAPVSGVDASWYNTHTNLTSSAITNAVAGNYSDAHDAFICGIYATVYGIGWDSANIGYAAMSTGDYSTAVGNEVVTSGTYSTALGHTAISSGDYSLALGANSNTSRTYNVAVGNVSGGLTRTISDIAAGSLDNDAVNVLQLHNLIRKDTNNAYHIGENSLVTQEVSGVQDLYATDSTGSQIDINIKSGTNLLIDGTNVMTSINSNTSSISTNTSNISTNTSNISSMNNRINNLSNDISSSVALSSALSALPTSSPDSFYTCGIGAGVHDSSSALSAGCASEFANYAFVDHMPDIFQTASFNIGSSFLMNGEPDISDARDMSIKAGITFKFGAPKPLRKTKEDNFLLENKIDAVMAKNETIKAENDVLKAQIAEINTQLKALSMLAMN